MGLFEEAVIYATQKHNGAVRKLTGIPAIMHAMEVAHIISTMTNDIELMAAGLLHDVVEDTDGTIEEIQEHFGPRVARLVSSETEQRIVGANQTLTWKQRKEESIKRLKSLNDRDVEILWLADKLSNIRSFSTQYSEMGENLWDNFHQKDPLMHQWYYKTIAEILEMHLNRTGAFKEYVKHINSIWPGTFATEKSRYKKYREVSLDGCKLIGRGAKGDVYRYDDELVLKVYNENNEYKDIERENYLARQAFIAGIPTAISFGIVKVGNRYGSMFELLNSSTVSALIATNPDKVDTYAQMMAGIARTIHHTDGSTMNIPSFMPEALNWVDSGLGYEDKALADRLKAMLLALPDNKTVIHGDFHTGNVMSQKDEFIIIDMDNLSTCHPIVELAGVYMFYIGFGELDKSMIENFMGFSYDVSKRFFAAFMEAYMGTADYEPVVQRAALLCYARLVRRCYKKGLHLSEFDSNARDYYMAKIRTLMDTVTDLSF